MATIAVVGGGLGGAAAALLLARRGHDVTVFERDAEPPPASPDEAWDRWDRRGVTQLRQSHLFIGRLHRELAEHAPDVLHALLAAGVHDVPWTERVPPPMRASLPEGIEEIHGLGARRTTVERVLHEALLREPGVTVRLGEAVESLITGPSVVPGVPHVVGLRTTAGEDITADLVLDVAGRRSPGARWLAAAGARPPHEEASDNRIAYYTRYYRLRDDASFPVEYGPLMSSLVYLDVAVFPADHGVFSVTCMAFADDKPMRALRDADTFTRVMRAIPRVAQWIDEEVAVPITPVKPIAAVDDRYRRFVVEGAPVATGIVAVGDAWSCTNPALGRGTSLAFVQARLLAETVDATGLDYAALATRFDQVTQEELAPWFWSSVAVDRERIQRMEAAIAGEPVPEPDPADMPAVLSRALRLAAMVDAEAFWAFSKVMHLMASPAEVFADEALRGRAIDVWERRHELPAPSAGPERRVVLDLLAAPR